MCKQYARVGYDVHHARKLSVRRVLYLSRKLLRDVRVQEVHS